MMNFKTTLRLLTKDKIHLTTQVFFYVALVVIAVITFYPIFNTGIGCADDMGSYMATRFGNQFTNAKYLAEMSGRFYYLIVAPFHNFSYIVDNQFIIKLFQIIPICFSLFLFYKIVCILTKSKELSALFVLLFFIVAQVSRHTCLFVTYPFYFTFSFSLLLIAYLLIYRFQKTKKYHFLIFSSCLYGFGLLFYEVYTLFIVFAFLSIIYNNINNGSRGWLLIKECIIQILPFVVVFIGYVSVYFIYSQLHPSQYYGSMLSDKTVTFSTFFTVLWKLSWTAFPLTVYDASHEFFSYKSDMITGFRNIVPYLFSYAHIEWLVKSLLVFVMSYFIMIRIPKIPYRIILIGFVLAVLLTFFPHIPLALTVKYTYYVMTQGMVGYITTFFSLFGVLLFLVLVCALLLNFSKTDTVLRHITTLVISVCFVLCAFLTDFSNYYISQDFHHANVRLYTVDEMIKSDVFKAIPASSNIYSSELWNNPYYMNGGLTEQGFQWTYYILCKTQIYQLMIRDQKDFLSRAIKTSESGYRIVYSQAYKTDDALLVLAELKPPSPADTVVATTSDKVLVVFYSEYKQFSLTFKRNDVTAINKVNVKINQITKEVNSGQSVEFTIFNTKFNDPSTIFTIEASSIDIKSIKVTNLINPESKVFYL